MKGMIGEEIMAGMESPPLSNYSGFEKLNSVIAFCFR